MSGFDDRFAPNDEAIISELNLFSEQTCAELCRRIHNLREHWVQRHESAPFFTLGAASYLDGDRYDAARYKQEMQRTRPLLSEHFAEIYEPLRLAFAEVMAAPCQYHPDLALPGFHVYLADPIFERRMGSIHIDLQYEQTGADATFEVDLRRQWSLTLALQLPRTGGGLRVWPVDGYVLRGADPEQRAKVLAVQPKASFHPYRVGALAVHSGFLFHQIAPITTLHPNDQRITLQAHAIWAGDRYLMYW